MAAKEPGAPVAPPIIGTVEPRLLGPAATGGRSALVPPLAAARWIIFLILAACVYFFHDFLVPVLAALIIGFASWPLYQRVLRACNGNRTLAASLMIAAITLFLIVPAFFAGMYAFREIQILLEWSIETNRNGAAAPDWFVSLPVIGDAMIAQWDQYVGRPALWRAAAELGLANIGTIYRSVLALGTARWGSCSTCCSYHRAALRLSRRRADRGAARPLRRAHLPGALGRISRVVPATISSI